MINNRTDALKNSRQFVNSTVRSTVYTNPSQKLNSSKTLFRPEKFENAGFAFLRGQNTFENVFKFLRRSVNGNHFMRFQSEISVFKFLRRSVGGKHLMRFQSETSVFKFLRRSVDGKHLMRFQSEISVFKFLRRSADETLHSCTTPVNPIETITRTDLSRVCSVGGYSQKNWVQVCGPLPKTLTLFMTKTAENIYKGVPTPPPPLPGSQSMNTSAS